MRLPVRVGSLLQDGLDLEADRHIVANRDSTSVHRDGEAAAEVAPTDLRGGGEAGPQPAEVVRAEPVNLDGQSAGSPILAPESPGRRIADAYFVVAYS